MTWQYDSDVSLAFVLGQLIGLQKDPAVRAIIAEQLGGEEEAEVFAKQMFKIGEYFLKRREDVGPDVGREIVD